MSAANESPKLSRRDLAAKEKHQKILSAALELFANRGFHGTAVPDVAKLAGVGAGTIYRYFENKEALVNAVYHRSYEIREPVEVRIGRRDLVVLSYPGPDRSVRLEQLREGKALPRRYRNRRIGELLKELDLTEGRGTGIPKILRAMRSNGSPDPVFEFDEDHSYFAVTLPVHPATLTEVEVATGEVTGEVTEQVESLVTSVQGERSRTELQQALGLRHEDHFRAAYLRPALESGLIEMTIPDKPRSSKQRYRLTAAGRAWKGAHVPGGEE